MKEHCPVDFDSTLLSAYLDGALTQQERQKVEIHLEDCTPCRKIFDDLKEIRETAMNTAFKEPADNQWDELPRNGAGTVTRFAGWLFIALWFVSVSVFTVRQVMIETKEFWPKFFFFTGTAGFLSLLVSIGLDRLKDMKTDRYREVKK